jgi:hypothetical protein
MHPTDRGRCDGEGVGTTGYKIAAPLIDAKCKLGKGRRSQPFIGGVGGCAVNHRGATYQ